MRAEKYRALGEIFSADPVDLEWCLRTLAAPCDGGMRPCPRQSTPAREAAGHALEWASGAGDPITLLAELVRLGGSPERVRVAPKVPLVASAYFDVPGDELDRRLMDVYRTLGYRCRADRTRPASHLAHEMGFLAHCHDLSVAGMPEAETAACSFTRDHVAAWAPVCAAAIERVAEHPVYRFAAIALEELLHCERLKCEDARRTALA